MVHCECATVAYYPNDFNNEHINVGFLLYDIDNGILKRSFIKKRQRLKEFDDRLTDKNIDIIFNVLETALDNEFPKGRQLSIFDDGKKIAKKSSVFKELGRMFLNSLKFVDIFNAYTDNVDAFFSDNVSLALYFDQSKRPSAAKISSIVRNRVSNAFLAAGLSSKSSYTVGDEITFGEKIRFDYECGGLLIKIIDPLSGSSEQKINLAKQWAFNISKYFNPNKELSVVIVIPDISECDKEFDSFKKIFASVDAQVMQLSDFVNNIANFEIC